MKLAPELEPYRSAMGSLLRGECSISIVTQAKALVDPISSGGAATQRVRHRRGVYLGRSQGSLPNPMRVPAPRSIRPLHSRVINPVAFERSHGPGGDVSGIVRQEAGMIAETDQSRLSYTFSIIVRDLHIELLDHSRWNPEKLISWKSAAAAYLVVTAHIHVL